VHVRSVPVGLKGLNLPRPTPAKTSPTLNGTTAKSGDAKMSVETVMRTRRTEMEFGILIFNPPSN